MAKEKRKRKRKESDPDYTQDRRQTNPRSLDAFDFLTGDIGESRGTKFHSGRVVRRGIVLEPQGQHPPLRDDPSPGWCRVDSVNQEDQKAEAATKLV